MTAKKPKTAEKKFDFTPKSLTAKDKKHEEAFGRVLKYFDENGGAYAYSYLKRK